MSARYLTKAGELTTIVYYSAGLCGIAMGDRPSYNGCKAMVGVSSREKQDRDAKTVARPESPSDGMFGVIPKGPDHVVAFHAGESLTVDATLQAVDARGAICPSARSIDTSVSKGYVRP
jgi:hypothetical protein